MKPCFFTIWFAFLLCACTSKPPQIAEKAIPKRESARALQIAAIPKAILEPASAGDVKGVLHRVFGDAVVADERQRWYTVGDFNGDGSPDLAVRLRPAKLSVVNDPLSNWIVQDAAHAFFPPVGTAVLFRKKGSPPAVRRNEALIAVIHGYGDEGWRDSQAQQAYLIKNGGSGSLETISAPHHVRGAPISINRSEVIYEDFPTPGILFWTGSQYAWRSLSERKGAALNASDTPRQTARSAN
jgi:hypothetical protein